MSLDAQHERFFVRGLIQVNELSAKVVNHHFGDDLLEDLFHKFHMIRMYLIRVLSRFVFLYDIERDLIALINHWSLACGHIAHVKMVCTRNIFQIFVGPIHQFLRSIWLLWVCPKNDNM